MDETWLKFVIEWLKSGKPEQTAGDLVVLAERAGIELRGETIRSKQTRLGLMLGRAASTTIKPRPFQIAGAWFVITRPPPYRGRLRWRIETSTNVPPR